MTDQAHNWTVRILKVIHAGENDWVNFERLYIGPIVWYNWVFQSQDGKKKWLVLGPVSISPAHKFVSLTKQVMSFRPLDNAPPLEEGMILEAIQPQ